MKLAFIHSDKKIGTGAHYINDLISVKLQRAGVRVKNFYPRTPLIEDSPVYLKGFANILFFYSLLERKDEVLRYDLVQGTTYTPLPFLAFDIPVVSHFGSTTYGFLKTVPLASRMGKDTKKIWYGLRAEKVISELNIRTRRPLRDIAEMEKYVASRATAVIAASRHIKKELVDMGVAPERIAVIHNAIEDYWYEKPLAPPQNGLKIVFLGRIGYDAFTLKLKGVDRLIHLYKKFPAVPKLSICMTTNKNLKNWLKANIENHSLFVNMKKDLIPNLLRPNCGSILFLPSRYEGFSLSLIEGMSQGLVPVTYPVGVAPEIIRDGINGFLVNSQDEAVARVRELLADESRRLKMAERARALSLEFKSDIMADRLVRLYRQILNREKISSY